MGFLKSAFVGLVFSAAAVSFARASDSSIRGRRLSYALIAGYEPQTKVTDHNALDLDQLAMEMELNAGAWGEAHHLYKDGGYSKVFANLTLTKPLKQAVPMGTRVKGKAHDGSNTRGMAMFPYKVGDSEIHVEYHINEEQDSYAVCQVGALWRTHDANLDGCFENGNGSVEVEGIGNYNYTYDIRRDNNAARTLAVLSTTADRDMLTCATCPFRTFEKFYEYYGKADYGHEWVTAAFKKRSTQFQNGNIDFSQATNKSRIEAIKKGTVGLNVFMAVIRKMENALDECEAKKGSRSVTPWDTAVAFYTGSLEGTDGKGPGKFLHELADNRCKNFKTCGKDGDSTSDHAKVNYEVFQQFKFGQRNLLAGKCADARANKERIEALMTIPMIQGTLRYAHIQSNPATANQKAAAEGATFAATVLPIVHKCDTRSAEAIHENMNFGASTSFDHVRNAFDKVYACMGVTCEDVGGYYDIATGEYFEGAAPCAHTGGSGGANAVGVAIGVTIAVIGVLVAALFVARRRRRSVTDKPPKKNPIFVTPEEPFT